MDFQRRRELEGNPLFVGVDFGNQFSLLLQFKPTNRSNGKDVWSAVLALSNVAISSSINFQPRAPIFSLA
jgi:hypothetical protein